MIQHLAFVKFLYITLGRKMLAEGTSLKLIFAILDSEINEFRRIYLCNSIGSKKLCGIFTIDS